MHGKLKYKISRHHSSGPAVYQPAPRVRRKGPRKERKPADIDSDDVTVEIAEGEPETKAVPKKKFRKNRRRPSKRKKDIEEVTTSS